LGGQVTYDFRRQQIAYGWAEIGIACGGGTGVEATGSRYTRSLRRPSCVTSFVRNPGRTAATANAVGIIYATADEADAYMFYRCFFSIFFKFFFDFCFFRPPKNTRQPGRVSHFFSTRIS